MKPSKAATNAAHLQKLERIVIQPYKAEGEQIKAAAKQAGQSTTAYILQAVRQRMAADAAGGYLIYMSKEQAAKNAEANNKTVATWASDHSKPKEDI